jgi:5-methylthioadenosine/S-adenosylhomocysteine deaminase
VLSVANKIEEIDLTMPRNKIDLFIKNCLIITMNPGMEIFRPGALAIQGDTIVAVGPEQELQALEAEARKIMDAQGGAILPGLINVHTHAAMTLFRGLADDLPLKTWLEEFIFPAEARFVNPDSVYWGTLLACAEMILSGTTTFADGYFCLDGVVKAVDRSGLRGLLCQGVVDFPAPGIPDPAQNILEVERFIEKWCGFSSRIEPGIFCHSPYICSPDTIRTVKEICRRKNVSFFIHAAETQEERSLIRTRYGKTPIHHLANLQVLDDQTLVVHAVHVDSEEIEILARTRTAVAHCPESNMKLASGIAPVVEMLNQGVLVGLGTDGCASNNDLDLFQEMDTAAKLGKVRTMDPTVMNARTVLRMATIDGARVLGLDKEVGSLEVGKKADMIFLDLNQPHLVPCYDPFSLIVYSARGSDVQAVMVEGRMVMENRKILTFDMEEVMDRVRRISGEIVSRK